MTGVKGEIIGLLGITALTKCTVMAKQPMLLAISQTVVLNRERVPHPENPITEPSFSVVSVGKSLVKTTPVTPQVRCNHVDVIITLPFTIKG